jgi:hypothetical protein
MTTGKGIPMRGLVVFLLTCSALLAGCAESDKAGRQADTVSNGMATRDEPKDEGPLTLWEYPALPYSAQQIEYVRLLQSELGVGTAVMELPPGKKDSAFRAEVNRHNEQARQRIEAKHGQGALGRVRQKAQEIWEARVKATRDNQGSPKPD